MVSGPNGEHCRASPLVDPIPRVFIAGPAERELCAAIGADPARVTDSPPTSPALEADLAQLVLYDRVLDEAAAAALAAR